MSEPFGFDFNDVDVRPRAVAAAESVSREQLAELFQRLEAANALWDDPAYGQRGAAVACLAALTEFFHAHGYSVGGGFSRPIGLLLQELQAAPAPGPGSILPPVIRGQAVEATRRQSVNRLKAAAAYTARALTSGETTLKQACNRVAAALIAHRFPAADYFRADGSEKEGPRPSTVAARIEEWCSDYKNTENEAGRIFRAFTSQPPVAAGQSSRVLAWLKGQLVAGGYESM